MLPPCTYQKVFGRSSNQKVFKIPLLFSVFELLQQIRLVQKEIGHTEIP